MRIVPGYGHMPNDVLLVGESPGINEFKRQEPFVGKSGAEQEWYLRRHGLTARSWYKTNVVKEFKPGNPDPTAEQVEYWSPVLQSEVDQCQPKLIVAVGRFAAQWFLGPADMESCHGIPHYAGAFKPEYEHRGGGAIVLPIYHPAVGLYDNDMKAVCCWDYEQVARILSSIKTGSPIKPRRDEYAGSEIYTDVSGRELAIDVIATRPDVIALDTEGTPADPWSLQVSWKPGTAYVLRRDREDFDLAIVALQQAADRGTRFVMHNAFYDIEMCRVMGLELRRADVWDSMYAAYLMRLEPQGLKPLAWRWLGVKMASYSDTVGDVGVAKQLQYLRDILSTEFDTPEPRAIIKNDGTSKMYKPQHVHKTVKGIIKDVESGKVTKQGPVDPHKRWHNIDAELRADVENVVGPMPIGTLADIPLDKAVAYSARDADISLRLYQVLSDELQSRGLDKLMRDGMDVLPTIEEINYTGLPASRSYFEALADEMTQKMDEIGRRMSIKYCDGKPFNPNSSQQTAEILEARGLEGLKQTKSGGISTAKPSIEYLRGEDEFVSDLFDWREYAHVRDAFCNNVLQRIPKHLDTDTIRCNIKLTRTTTRRLASSDPNLLAIPNRSELGRRVRQGYIAPEGYVFAAWDLSQIEARFIAHESLDPKMLDLFINNRDMHTETAASVFGVGLDQVTKLQRAVGKTVNFLTIYGGQEHTLMLQLKKEGIDYDKRKCRWVLDRWQDTYSGVVYYWDRVFAETCETGVSADVWGMPRYLPGVWSKDERIKAEAKRLAVSQRIQGGAQGMIQHSMAWLKPHIWGLQDAGHDVRWCLQIHDELLFLFPEELWDTMDPLVVEALTKRGGVKLRVPVLAGGAMGRTWGDCK